MGRMQEDLPLGRVAFGAGSLVAIAASAVATPAFAQDPAPTEDDQVDPVEARTHTAAMRGRWPTISESA